MTAQDVGIAGALLQPLKVIPTEGGPVLHMLRPGSPLLPDFSKGFGEIYFSEVLPGHVKAWKRHTRQTQDFAVPSGQPPKRAAFCANWLWADRNTTGCCASP